jgi:hypothetical protein
MITNDDDRDILQQIDNLLNANRQSWLLGAGTSLDSGIPLMGGLTKKVIDEVNDDNHKQALEAIRSELEESCHIEHILSHLSDCRAIADRKRDKSISFGKKVFSMEELDSFHSHLLTLIADTIRWGYKEPDKNNTKGKTGTYETPIVTVDNQKAFIDAVFNHRQKNVSERRQPIQFFTTNYDTLIEDALALNCIKYWDGFDGGAVGFRSRRYGDKNIADGYKAHVIKLHGSIDWHLDSDGKVWRVRDNDLYPDKSTRVLIYPQATKYIATQRDPFAVQFEQFRHALSSRSENLFAICGYSFGDDHINQEIQLGMEYPENKTTVIAFANTMNSTLKSWMKTSWCKRLYAICEDGIYVGGNGPYVVPTSKTKREWWKFQHVTKMLKSGPEACLQ